ncbi:hypothetical protein O6P43_000359 [Quillaja saponaria]|uniref:Uncharacterized protein n=1 Tax=Quillaja saponaria TaxID=32244 RepID=A0AAD7QGI4_QUISA|nr:hypothetical protein O6P43_000359 [Quillaja saponaria]
MRKRKAENTVIRPKVKKQRKRHMIQPGPGAEKRKKVISFDLSEFSGTDRPVRYKSFFLFTLETLIFPFPNGNWEHNTWVSEFW